MLFRSLSKCPFLESLSKNEITKLAGALETSSYEEGDYILKQGDIGDSFLIIEEGNVKCTQKKTNGQEFDLM